jgi:hypothetical protein
VDDDDDDDGDDDDDEISHPRQTKNPDSPLYQ